MGLNTIEGSCLASDSQVRKPLLGGVGVGLLPSEPLRSVYTEAEVQTLDDWPYVPFFCGCPYVPL